MALDGASSGGGGFHSSDFDRHFDSLSKEQVEWCRMALQSMEHQIERLLRDRNLLLEFKELDEETECNEFYEQAGGCSEGLLQENAKKNRYCNVIPFDRTRVKLGVARSQPVDVSNNGFLTRKTASAAMECMLTEAKPAAPSCMSNNSVLVLTAAMKYKSSENASSIVTDSQPTRNNSATENRLAIENSPDTGNRPPTENAFWKSALATRGTVASKGAPGIEKLSSAAVVATNGTGDLKDAQAMENSTSVTEAAEHSLWNAVQAINGAAISNDAPSVEGLSSATNAVPVKNDAVALNDSRAVRNLSSAAESLLARDTPSAEEDMPGNGGMQNMNGESVKATRQATQDSSGREHVPVMVWKSTSDYINASYVRDEKCPTLPMYIATQGPLRSTEVDFWRMVVENNCKAIVMLTREFEGGRTKCRRYFPSEENETLVFSASNLLITTKTKKFIGSPIVFRELELSQVQPSCNSSFIGTVHHYQILNWPDHGTPLSSGPLRALMRRFRIFPLVAGPLVVHCSAGIGRTGVYIIVDHTLRRILEGDLGAVDVMATVRRLRTQRPGLVQTKEQYLFCFMAIREELMEFVLRRTVDSVS